MKINLGSGTGYLALNDSAKSKHTLPIDSVVLFLNRLKGPIGFRIVKDSNANEWLDTWQEISPVNFETFLDSLKNSSLLNFQEGAYFLVGNSKKDISYEIESSCYVDFDEQSEILGLEFLFQSI